MRSESHVTARSILIRTVLRLDRLIYVSLHKWMRPTIKQCACPLPLPPGWHPEVVANAAAATPGGSGFACSLAMASKHHLSTYETQFNGIAQVTNCSKAWLTCNANHRYPDHVTRKRRGDGRAAGDQTNQRCHIQRCWIMCV